MNTGLGDRIKRLRLARDLTLKDVGSKAGLSATHLSEIERGKTSPTVGVLVRIAAALGEEAARLIEESPPAATTVVRAGGRRELVEDGVVLQPLAGTPVPGEISVIAVTMPPASVLPVLAGPGERCIVVVEGAVEVEAAGVVRVLHEGDAIHFRDEDCRRVRNPEDRPSRLLWVASPPAVL